jgi:hypothetical protein
MSKKLTVENQRVGSGAVPVQSLVEPELIDQNEEEYDDEPQEARGESSATAEGESFGSQDVFDATAKAKEQEFIQQTVGKINAMYRQNVDNGKLEIGRYLLDEVFGGQIEEAMSTNPHKPSTFSRIAQDPDLLVEPQTLGSWVRAAAVDQDFSQRGFEFPHLTTYHYVELAKVKDQDRRVEIAKDANERDLTVKDLRKLISEEKGNGQSASETMKQEVHKTMKTLAELSVSEGFLEFVGDMSAIKGAYSPGKALDLIPEVYASLENVQATAQLLETFANNLDEIVNETRKRRSA